ncbi:hypothetical protein O181_058996 [Austropuccinia psidii MF-1]|uniref:Uncharacterized protein n=1 Tax=Austropuccinia psidii MF-1 TaxID=1389203 RepID=A0A9Q3HVC1_9BASI|nr:hypothetical protein [Austropuccinia psidii MF-1]
MPVQHSPPSKNTRSQRHQAVLTPTARALLDHTPSVHQLRPRHRLGGAEDEEGKLYMEEEEYEETEVEASLEGSAEPSEAPNLTLSNQHLVSQAEPNLLNIMEKMTHFRGQLTQAVVPRDNSRASEFKTP